MRGLEQADLGLDDYVAQRLYVQVSLLVVGNAVYASWARSCSSWDQFSRSPSSIVVS